MIKMKAKKWILSKNFCGQPTEENLSLVEFEIPEQLKENEVLLQAVYLSVDPYMKVWKKKEGQTMIGEQLSEVIESRNPIFPKGTMVLSHAGWITNYKSKGDDLNFIRFDLGKTPISYTLGVLGMTGATAYFGLKKCSPKQGEVFLVSCAAGAVGSIVGQLAKLKGLKVIGLVGSDEKVKFCKEIGFDQVFNYNSCNINEEIKLVVPDGVDVYFDNAGGTFYSSIIENNMKNNGRVLVCGSIQTYCCEDPSKYEKDNLSVIDFRSSDYSNDWPKAYNEMNKLIQGGKLTVKEKYDSDIKI
ncbi:prostaglandin reductase 1 [Brachionus plicatilis]|uniref:15-oxoprostaglandin 13-reductase n=1 Tax=Brachionus plicatilis TaxID=10195 RepID=A0A3M7RGD7_BRAPC|nr:prostaglandin reductase 1 [Brachionus plicatilis]